MREQAGAELCQAQNQLGWTRLGYARLCWAVSCCFATFSVGVGWGWVVGLLKNKTKLSPTRASLLGLSLAKTRFYCDYSSYSSRHGQVIMLVHSRD